ncbi:MAG: hypothetical protein ACRDRP_17725 [Pseudonocardiaceae bacterium]
MWRKLRAGRLDPARTSSTTGGRSSRSPRRARSSSTASTRPSRSCATSAGGDARPGTPFPISFSEPIYANPKPGPDGWLDVQRNFARVGSDEIDQLFDQATAELDPAKAVRLANEIDGKIWAGGEVEAA